MHIQRMFLTFTSLEDPSKHREYNEWHQLDHLPENLLLPGVAWGDRWVRTPDCRPDSEACSSEYELHEYAIMYWFRSPAAESVAEWTELNQRALWWGRRPELAWTRRQPVGFFEPVKGYAAPRVLVDAEALLYRPHRGILMTLSRIGGPGAAESVQVLADYDRVHIPNLLDIPGVAGVWTYRFTGGAAGFGAVGEEDNNGLFVKVVYFDDDPVAVSARIRENAPAWAGAGGEQEQVLFSSPLRSIIPWEWDWFLAG